MKYSENMSLPGKNFLCRDVYKRQVLGTELVYQGADHYHGYEVRHIADGLNTFLKKFPSHLIQKMCIRDRSTPTLRCLGELLKKAGAYH